MDPVLPDERSPEVVAGIDLGSNSFHMIVVRAQRDGVVHTLDKLKEPVRLAAGLTAERELDEAAQRRGLAALARFAERLQQLPRAHVRAVGTNTLRMARNGPAFLEKARRTLGHPIDIISGPEEARLIYAGVAHSSFFIGRRLVMDIGGGSTELIVGEGFEPILRDSMFMGCVSFSKRFFPKGRLTEGNFHVAEVAARRELRSVADAYRELGWSRATGASGTLKAIDTTLKALGWSRAGITLDGLKALKAKLLETKRVERIEIEGLEDDRAPVFAGGLAIVRAAFDILGIDVMDVSEGALREGAAYELLGRSRQGDVRDRTTRSMAERYRVELDHTTRVEEIAIELYEQVKEPWDMPVYRSRKFLHWASQVHEIGLSIAYAGHHKHAGYLLRHAEMPGFSREQQAMLAAIVENQRRKPRPKRFERLAPDRQKIAVQLAILLRLSVLLNRARRDEGTHEVRVSRADDRHLTLAFPKGWLGRHPMTLADLEEEAEYLNKLGMKLDFS